jgi:hypothetical protein
MPRIRTIKPEFWSHDQLSSLAPEVHMLAAALINYADDEGYFLADHRLVKANTFPLREDSVSIHGGLTELSNIGFIQVGKDDRGRLIGKVVNFEKHQRVNRPTPSKFKGICQFSEDSVSIHGGLSESSLLEQGTGNREREQGKGKGKDKENPLTLSKHFFSESFLEAWALWEEKQQSNRYGKALDKSTIKAQLYTLENFTTEEAIEIVRYSTSRTNCLNLITNGDHRHRESSNVNGFNKKNLV